MGTLEQQTSGGARPVAPDIRLALRACPRNVAVVRHVCASLAEALGMDAASVGRLTLAVSEAGTNVVLHAYGAGDCGLLEVDAIVEDGCVHVIVRDRGGGVRLRPDSPGLGLGLPLIASISDGLEIRADDERGNEVRMTFARGYDRDVADPREDRIARNEASFRALNESIETQVHGRLSGEHSELRGFVCECGDPDCVEIVRMTTIDYEAIRRDPHLFFVRPGHQAPEVEDVVRREEVFLVVRKHDEVADIVEATDPRAD